MAEPGSTDQPFVCDVLEPNGEILLNVAGEVDLRHVASLRCSLARAVGRGKPLFVDLTSVSFIDGRGFRAIGDAAHWAADAGLAVTVVAPSALVGRILLATAGDALDVVEN